MRPLLTIIALVLLGAAFGAQAGSHDKTATYHYRWVDAAGLPHYSDSLSVKALQFGYDVLGPRGRVVRHVPRTLASDDGAKTIPATPRRTAAEQHRQDRQLLMAYPTEAGFKAAQQARIDQIHQYMHTTRLNLDSQEHNLAQLLGNAADFSRQGKAVPHALSKRITKQRHTVNTQRQQLKRQQAKLAEARQQVAAKLAHYHALLARQKARYGR